MNVSQYTMNAKKQFMPYDASSATGLCLRSHKKNKANLIKAISFKKIFIDRFIYPRPWDIFQNSSSLLFKSEPEFFCVDLFPPSSAPLENPTVKKKYPGCDYNKTIKQNGY